MVSFWRTDQWAIKQNCITVCTD